MSIRHGLVAASAGYLLPAPSGSHRIVKASEWSADMLSEAPNRVSGNNEPVTPSVAKIGHPCRWKRTFEVEHFSYWALGAYNDSSDSGKNGGGPPIWIVAIVAIVTVAGIGAFFSTSKKKA
ncbi:hypothetical protein PAA26_04900 [Methanomassiliicoccaceae archaeon COG_1]|nr:hypothetical protein [Methanomassiliicoccaceae archaeon COG_1]